MTTDPEPDPTEPDTEETEPDTGQPDTEETEPDKVSRSELDKAIARRDKALEAARKAKAELDAIKGDKDKPTEPDPVEKANERLVRAEARSVLATAGITDKAEQKAVLDVLRLDGVEVDEDGEVDSEELESRISELRRIFGGSKPTERRVPRVDTRDRGGRTAEPTDPDKARRLRFLTGRPTL